MARQVRVIISFQRETTENPRLSAAIAEACRCQPVFVRPYLRNAHIYELPLPAGQTFAVFESRLMLKAVGLGIKAVEQDRIVQHQ